MKTALFPKKVINITTKEQKTPKEHKAVTRQGKQAFFASQSDFVGCQPALAFGRMQRAAGRAGLRPAPTSGRSNCPRIQHPEGVAEPQDVGMLHGVSERKALRFSGCTSVHPYKYDVFLCSATSPGPKHLGLRRRGRLHSIHKWGGRFAIANRPPAYLGKGSVYFTVTFVAVVPWRRM